MKNLKATRAIYFTAITLFILIFSSELLADDWKVECENGSVNGSRTEYSGGNFTVEDDRVTLKPMSYDFDTKENDGYVMIKYGKQKIAGLLLNSTQYLRTTVYLYSGVTYMDTFFLSTGKVLSSEHKSLTGENVATNWRLDCSAEYK